MEFGLMDLCNDDYILNLAQYIGENKSIRVYVEHGSTNLVFSNMSPNGGSRAFLKGLDQGTPEPYLKRNRKEKVLHGQPSCSKKLCLSNLESDVVNEVIDDASRPQQEQEEEQQEEQEQNVVNEAIEEKPPYEHAPFYKVDYSNINELDEPYFEPEVDVEMYDFNVNLHIEDSDEERKRTSILKEMVKEKQRSLGHSHRQNFYIGHKFKSKQELKENIEVHALETRRNLVFKKNDKKRLIAICIGFSVVNDDQESGCNKGRSKSDVILNHMCEVLKNKLGYDTDIPIGHNSTTCKGQGGASSGIVGGGAGASSGGEGVARGCGGAGRGGGAAIGCGRNWF
ncbi:hypothetical protein LXL04_004494 [Taraxacum kok-saghyz]